MPHLFVDISSHGYGHLAQTAPVLNRLAELRPDIRVTLRSGLPLIKLKQRIRAPFEHIAAASDFGYVMVDALTIDAEATRARYREAHRDFDGRVADEAALFRKLHVDAVFANVAYLPLAGATAAGIPAMALCSLNWADLYAHYFGADPTHAEMLAAYRSATFLRTTPGMPMDTLDPRIDIAAIATRGSERRAELHAKVGADKTARFVLIALGGIPTRLPVEHWPELPDTHWLVPQSWDVQRKDMQAFEPLDFPFVDLLRSVDAVVTKPGYGTFTEAACNGAAVLYQRRDDGWPEQDCLIDWLQAYTRCAEVSADDLRAGNLGPALETCLEHAVRPTPTFDGADAAARYLLGLLA
ncbi:MAG: hypothetical protein AB1443_08640 [Pseudomonadota bacterium]